MASDLRTILRTILKKRFDETIVETKTVGEDHALLLHQLVLPHEGLFFLTRGFFFLSTPTHIRIHAHTRTHTHTSGMGMADNMVP